MKKAWRSDTETGFNAIAQSQHFRVLQIERAIVFRKAKRNLKIRLYSSRFQRNP
jgi:hypothetical protein